MNTGKPLDRVFHGQPTGQVAMPVCKESSLEPRAWVPGGPLQPAALSAWDVWQRVSGSLSEQGWSLGGKEVARDEGKGLVLARMQGGGRQAELPFPVGSRAHPVRSECPPTAASFLPSFFPPCLTPKNPAPAKLCLTTLASANHSSEQKCLRRSSQENLN